VLGKIRQIIEVFAPDRPELTFLEIRKATGLPASTCQRLVANMVAEQFLTGTATTTGSACGSGTGPRRRARAWT